MLEVSTRTARQCDASAGAALATAYRCLHATGRHALRRIECDFEDDTLILHGTVSTFYEKQLAQAVLLNQPEITTISNRVYVTVKQ